MRGQGSWGHTVLLSFFWPLCPLEGAVDVSELNERVHRWMKNDDAVHSFKIYRHFRKECFLWLFYLFICSVMLFILTDRYVDVDLTVCGILISSCPHFIVLFLQCSLPKFWQRSPSKQRDRKVALGQDGSFWVWSRVVVWPCRTPSGKCGEGPRSTRKNKLKMKFRYCFLNLTIIFPLE